MPSDAQVQEMWDKLEIREVLMRYARGLDRFDEELVASVYHDDGMDDHGGVPLSGRALAREVIGTINARYRITRHLMTTMLIEVDGDVARTETYYTACHRYRENGEEVQLTSDGRYLDRFEKRGGVWKIAYRWRVRDWTRLEKVTDGPPPRPGWLMGEKSMADPLYKVFAAPR